VTPSQNIVFIIYKSKWYRIETHDHFVYTPPTVTTCHLQFQQHSYNPLMVSYNPLMVSYNSLMVSYNPLMVSYNSLMVYAYQINKM